MQNGNSGGSTGHDPIERYLTTPTRAWGVMFLGSTMVAVSLIVTFDLLTSERVQSTTDPGQLLLTGISVATVIFAVVAVVCAVGVLGSVLLAAWNAVYSVVVE